VYVQEAILRPVVKAVMFDIAECHTRYITQFLLFSEEEKEDFAKISFLCEGAHTLYDLSAGEG